MTVYTGATTVTDDDVVCGEGRQIVFVEPARRDRAAPDPGRRGRGPGVPRLDGLRQSAPMSRPSPPRGTRWWSGCSGARCGCAATVTRIPEKLQPKPKRTVRVQAYDDAGALVHDVDVKSDDFHMVTGVREHDGRVWMGSLEEPAVAFHQL